jgi:hypothetical protein
LLQGVLLTKCERSWRKCLATIVSALATQRPSTSLRMTDYGYFHP